MTVLVFLPSSVPAGFSAIKPVEAVQLAAEAAVGPWSSSEERPSNPRYKQIGNAIRQATHDILEDLGRGVLAAYIHRPDTGASYLVPAEYWADDSMASARLHHHPQPLDERIPPPFREGVIFLLLEDVKRWTRFRTTSALSRRGAPRQYDAEAFEAEAVRKFDEEGDYQLGGFRPADMEEHMERWCGANWERTPGRTWMQNHIKNAQNTYLELTRRGDRCH